MRNAVFYSILITGFLTSGMISAQGKQRQYNVKYHATIKMIRKRA